MGLTFLMGEVFFTLAPDVAEPADTMAGKATNEDTAIEIRDMKFLRGNLLLITFDLNAKGSSRIPV
jgi:hypothetical protein